MDTLFTTCYHNYSAFGLAGSIRCSFLLNVLLLCCFMFVMLFFFSYVNVCHVFSLFCSVVLWVLIILSSKLFVFSVKILGP